jgi:YVTN family beta-propeller protein
MDFRILGPLEVMADGRQVPLGGGRQRAVLAILLIHRREVVSVDRLADELWGDRPPDTATKTVQVYVSRLRKLLGNGALVTRGGGYALDVGDEQVDADRFERLAREGRDALEAGDARAAAERLRAALELWRGEPLADFGYEDFARNEAARLEELRLGVLEDRIEADLALGRHGALVSELESLVAEHPTRERLRGQLMLALYRSGRQPEALETYRDFRARLDRELGLEPGPELQRLERAILTQDAEIAAPRRSRTSEVVPTRRGGILILAGGALLLAAAVAAVVAIAGEGGPASEPAAANSVAVIDPESNQVTATVPTGVRPTDVSAGSGSIWVANTGDDSVTRIDPKTKTAVSTTSPGSNVDGLAAGAGAVWIAASRGSELVRLDPVLRAERSIPIAPAPDPFPVAASSPVAAGDGAVWAIRARREIARVDPGRQKVVARVAVGNAPTAIATGARAVWVADADDNNVTRLGPGAANSVTKTTPVGQEPSAVALGDGAVWVANTEDGTVARIDPASASVTDTISVGGRPTGIAAGDGAVWVANSLDGTVSRIDPESNEVVATIDIGEAPQGLTIAHGLVWVSVQAKAEAPTPPADLADADVARVLADDPGSTDPALAGDYQIGFATCALLYNYPDRPFPAGSRLRPEVAAGQPIISNGGRKYTFEIRSGFSFSPPSDEPVTAAAFQRAIERALSPKMNAYGGGLVQDIAGATAYAAGKAHHLSGVSAHGDELVIRLAKPVPNLPARLSAQYFCAVPPGTPVDPEGVDELPSAGPYYVTSYEPKESLVLRRNPNYDGPRPHGLAEIQFTFGTPSQRAVAEIEAGHADYVGLDPEADLSPKTGRRLEERYGPHSQAARAGRQQLFTQPAPAVFSFVFNTRRGPFRDERLRRAVNYAIDRRALAQDTGLGGAGRPTDQYIPPGFPGFEDVPIYPLGGPDVAAARRLAGDLKRNAVLYTCDSPGCIRNGQILRSNLRAIGIHLEVRQFPEDEMFRREFRPDEPWDIGLYGWVADYGDPYNYINDQFAAGAPRPGGFSDPWFERRMNEAARLQGDARLRAYAKLDRDLAARAAPQATFASGETSYFLSARMGCEVPHPIYGLDFAALCVRDEASD